MDQTAIPTPPQRSHPIFRVERHEITDADHGVVMTEWELIERAALVCACLGICTALTQFAEPNPGQSCLEMGRCGD